jgi:hypothetical protein
MFRMMLLHFVYRNGRLIYITTIGAVASLMAQVNSARNAIAITYSMLIMPVTGRMFEDAEAYQGGKLMME